MVASLQGRPPVRQTKTKRQPKSETDKQAQETVRDKHTTGRQAGRQAGVIQPTHRHLDKQGTTYSDRRSANNGK